MKPQKHPKTHRDKRRTHHLERRAAKAELQSTLQEMDVQ